MANESKSNTPKQSMNIDFNFTIILHEAISQELKISNNNNDKNSHTMHIPNLDYNTFISLNNNEFCKLLKEESNIAHGKGVQIYKAIKDTLHSQTDDNNSNNHHIRLDSKLRDQFHWLHVNDDAYTSELVNECWNELIKDNEIKSYNDNKEYQSKMAVMLFTMLSDERVAKTIHKLTKNDMNMMHILYTKANKAIHNEDWKKALLYLDQALTFNTVADANTDNIYKIWLRKSDCLLMLKQYEKALNLAEKCVNIKSISVKPYLNAGNALMELQRFEEAKEMFEKAYRFAQSNPDSNNLLQKELPIAQLMLKSNANVCDNVDVIRMNRKDILAKWMKILDGKNDVIMEYEASQSNCNGYKGCPCLHRVLHALKIYNVWSTKYAQYWKQSMYGVLKEMKYSECCLLNDVFHIRKIHCNDGKIWDYIEERMECSSNGSQCVLYTRNNRNRNDCSTMTARKRLYYGLYESKDIAVLQILDCIHSCLLHNNNVREDGINNKFVTAVVDDDEFKSLNFGTFFKQHSETKTNNDTYCVETKYSTLKDELLSNTIYPLSNYQWMDVYIRAQILRKTLHSKHEWRAHDNGLLNISSGVKAGGLIDLDQLISLFIAINFETVSSLYISAGFRRIKDEELGDLKERYREISIWSLRLRESVWFFGDFCTSHDFFYHGFSKKIWFIKYHITIELPLFVTRDLDLLSTNHDGIIFKLSGDTGCAIGYPYFNTCFVSDFNYTSYSEALFFHCNLKLNDLFYENESYSSYLNSLFLFSKIMNGYYIEDMLKYENDLIEMMKGHAFMNKEKVKDASSSIPLYIQQLFDCFCHHKSSDIWFISSELNKLSTEFQKLLFDNDEYGEFLSVWKKSRKNEMKIKFVYEFRWDIVGDLLSQFHALQLEQAITGPIFCCKMENKQEDDEDDDLKMVDNKENDEQTLNVDECVVFIPYCRKSTMREEDFGEFGLVLQKLPHHITSILFEYEVYCREAQYSLCVPPQKWMSVGENIAFTSFKTDKIGNMAPFTYNVALKIKQRK